MRLRIAVHDPTDGSVKEVEFESSPVRIGRRPGNDLVLRHNFVSEPHALIEFDATGVKIVDLGSRNGTIVGGKAITRDQPTPMVGRTQIDIGAFMLIVSTPAPGDGMASGDLSSTMVLPQLPEPPLNWTQPAPPRPVSTEPSAEMSPGPLSWPPAGVPSPPWSDLPAFLEAAPAAANVPIVIELRAHAPTPPARPVTPPTPALDPARELAIRAFEGPLRDLFEESFEEATFLWGLWEGGLVSHARDLARLASFVEERLLGALDGVRLGLDGNWEDLLGKALASEERWPLAAAVHLTVAADPCRDSLLALIAAADGERLGAFRRGVELAKSDDDVARVEAKLAAGGLEQLAALVTLRAFRRRPPGTELGTVLRAEAPSIRAAGLRAARYVPHGGALGHVELALGDPEPLVGAAAVETGLVLGSRAAWMRCRELARAPSAATAGPLLLVASLGTARDLELVFAALGVAGLRKDVLKALAAVGTTQAAEACLEALSFEADSRLAAESFCVITGLDLHAENLIAPDPPEPEEPLPLEAEDLDADLVPGPDDFLPWPDVEGIRRWWVKNQKRLAGGGRFILGKPASLEALQHLLEVGSTRRRHAAALELLIRTGGRYDVETTAFTNDQRRQMAGFAAIKDGRSQPASLAGLISRI
jgi:uncharacterized protein (TIGR02270 family)